MLSHPTFQHINAEVQRGVAMCKETCEYFVFCGGGSPVNKLSETGHLCGDRNGALPLKNQGDDRCCHGTSPETASGRAFNPHRRSRLLHLHFFFCAEKRHIPPGPHPILVLFSWKALTNSNHQLVERLGPIISFLILVDTSQFPQSLEQDRYTPTRMSAPESARLAFALVRLLHTALDPKRSPRMPSKDRQAGMLWAVCLCIDW